VSEVIGALGEWAVSHELVKQHETFIHGRVLRFCRLYPWLDPYHVMQEALRLARQAAENFDPGRGVLFRTFVSHHLKGLTRFAEHVRQESQFALSDAELSERRRIKRTKFPEGNGTRLTFDRRQGSGSRRRRAFVRTTLPHKEPTYALSTAENISSGFGAISLADPEIIRAMIRRAAGEPITANVHCIDYTREPQPFEHPEWDYWLVEMMYQGRQFLTPNAIETRRRELVEAANALSPQLNDSAIAVLDWMLGQIDESDSRNQTELAKDVGITKGAVTQARDKLTGMLEAWCDKQRN
jgi:hypothetical protein